METNNPIVCPAYLIADALNKEIVLIEPTDDGQDWFRVYYVEDDAEQAAKRAGGTFRVRRVNDPREFRTIIKDNPQIAGFLTHNTAQPNLSSPLVTRQELLGDSG